MPESKQLEGRIAVVEAAVWVSPLHSDSNSRLKLNLLNGIVVIIITTAIANTMPSVIGYKKL
jgi:hypothetical protein